MTALWAWLAKPYRLITTALAVVMATIFTFNVIFHTGALDGTGPGEALAWVAGASFVLMAVGLGAIQQRMVEIGLLLAAGVLVARLAFLAMTGLTVTAEFWFNVAWTVAACGAYMLEAMDAKRHIT